MSNLQFGIPIGLVPNCRGLGNTAAPHSNAAPHLCKLVASFFATHTSLARVHPQASKTRYPMSENDEKRRRRRRSLDDDDEMEPPPPETIAAMLETVRASERQWTLHTGTGVCYHQDKCETCSRYVQHLAQEKEERNVSLVEAIEELGRYWEGKVWASKELKAQKKRSYDSGYDEGYERGYSEADARRSQRGRDRSLETQQTTTSSSMSSRQRSPKGKRPMSSIENELNAKTQELERLQRQYALATAEISRLRKENFELNATLQSRAIEAVHADRYIGDYGDMELDYGPQPEMLRQGHAGPPTQRVPMGGRVMQQVPTASASGLTATAPSHLAYLQPNPISVNSYASVAKEANKRKAVEPASAAPESKKPRPQKYSLADARTGLPIPLGRNGQPHFADGPWGRFTTSAPGENLNAKVEWLLTHRYAPCYRPILDELKLLRQNGAKLHPLQKKVLEHRGDPESLYEIAHSNRSKVHKGVRFVEGEPLPADMVLWELVRTIQRSSKDRERTLMLRQTVNDAVLDGSLWRGRRGQSTGISPTPFPENLAITKLNIAVHMMSCGVTTQFWDEHLRPFVSRGIGHQPSAVVNHDSPEPGQILTPTTSARNLAKQQSGDGESSTASTPPAPSEARPISRARSQSAPPNPIRVPDGDVAMEPAEASADTVAVPEVSNLTINPN
jgi:hypothetical protein